MTFESISTRSFLKCFLVTVVGYMPRVVFDGSEGFYLELLVLDFGLIIL